MKINKIKSGILPADKSIIILAENLKSIPSGILSAAEMKYLRTLTGSGKNEPAGLNRLRQWVFVYLPDGDKSLPARLEKCSKAGNTITKKLNAAKSTVAVLAAYGNLQQETLALAEGMALGNYQFIKYKSDAKDVQNSLTALAVLASAVEPGAWERLNIITNAVYRCRDLVNEPVIKLNAAGLATEFVRMGKEAGFKVEVMNHAKIKSLKMGGLLAVNLGSPDPPTFTVMEYKPKTPVNKKPFVLVGKGVVYDTGGLSLKPTSSMVEMKCDMSGAAAVGTTIYALAKMQLPVWIIGLVPATDNRPSGNAQVPGDVITMFDGTTVEVLNTDAEGRLILADALAYAKKYKPELVIDIATLTGSAQAAVGKFAMAGMQATCDAEFKALQQSGEYVCERIVEFPLWDDYKELIKSEIADLKNVGGAFAGAITAGKFLEHFTDYPFIHLDIAGTAFAGKADSYRGTGGTGSCVRLLCEYFSRKAKPGKTEAVPVTKRRRS